MKKSFTGEMK